MTIGSKHAALTGAYLGGLILVGGALRLYQLDALGLSNDESIQAVAVQSILSHGYPTLATGVLYLRSLPVLYLEALSALALGWGEFSLRLPSVLFGLAVIPLTYLFARDLLGRRTALVAALAITVSVWEIELSRVARMYAAFQFLFILTLYAFYQGFIRGSRGWRYATWPLLLITFATHDLSFPLTLIFLFAMLADGARRMSPLRAFGYVGASGMLYLLYLYGVSGLFPTKAASPSSILYTPGGPDAGAMATWLGTLTGRFFVLPELPLFQQVQASSPLVGWSILAAPLLLVAVAWRVASPAMRLERSLTLLLVAGSCALQQIGLACVVLLLSTLWSASRAALSLRSLTWPLAVIMSSFVAWFGYALWRPGWAAGLSGSGTIRRRSLSVLLDYPRLYDNHVAFLLDGWPVFSVFLAVGLLLLLRRHLHAPTPAVLYLLGAAYLLPLLVNGLVGPEWDKPRYFFHVHVTMIIMFAYCCVALAERAVQCGRRLPATSSLPPPWSRWSLAIALLLALVLTNDFDLLAPVSTAQSGLDAAPASTLRSLNRYRPFEVDYRTCSRHVQHELRPGDLVITMGPPVTRYVYTGQIDYFVMKQRRAGPVDRYTGSRHLSSLDALSSVLDGAAGRRVWILGDHCASTPNWYTPAMCDYLDRLDAEAVCQGDGNGRAYLLNGTPASRPRPAGLLARRARRPG